MADQFCRGRFAPCPVLLGVLRTASGLRTRGETESRLTRSIRRARAAAGFCTVTVVGSVPAPREMHLASSPPHPPPSRGTARHGRTPLRSSRQVRSPRPLGASHRSCCPRPAALSSRPRSGSAPSSARFAPTPDRQENDSLLPRLGGVAPSGGASCRPPRCCGAGSVLRAGHRDPAALPDSTAPPREREKHGRRNGAVTFPSISRLSEEVVLGTKRQCHYNLHLPIPAPRGEGTGWSGRPRTEREGESGERTNNRSCV